MHHAQRRRPRQCVVFAASAEHVRAAADAAEAAVTGACFQLALAAAGVAVEGILMGDDLQHTLPTV